ncbi:MAG: glycosyltransferase family A protein [Candidatus Nomurabacteria bacterium]|nr:glycosyltransferase family A protein [Candidatus Nomurabacteria bacterium]
MQTRISVIIPTYNGAKTLEAVIKSCLKQTLQPIEILVCDDGSTDESKIIVERINDNRVIWVPSQHSGTPAVPRNNGMKISKGEWIAFCDSDDEWLPTKLEKQINLAIKLKLKAACTSALIKINGNIKNELVSNWNKENITFSNILKSNDIVCSSVIIHKSIINNIGEFSTEIKNRSFADYIYWLRVLTETNFAFVVEPLVIYDDHPETSIRNDRISDKELQETSFNDLISWMKKDKKNKLKILYFKIQIYLYKVKQKNINMIKNHVKLIIK